MRHRNQDGGATRGGGAQRVQLGPPVQALVHTFAVDERTMAALVQRAGQYGRAHRQHLVQQRQIDLQRVQADELWVKLVRQRVRLPISAVLEATDTGAELVTEHPEAATREHVKGGQ